MMTKPMDLPGCTYPKDSATLVTPCSPTPTHALPLSNLDDQPFLRFSIRYLYLFNKSPCLDSMKLSLARVLVPYYPLAGRLTPVAGDRLAVDCNGQGALFAIGAMDLTAAEFLQGSSRPNRSWRKMLYKVDQGDGGVPPLVVQAIRLTCGGLILCTAINHALCDGVGTAQFLHAWAQATAKPAAELLVTPFHGRHLLTPRSPPPGGSVPHPEFSPRGAPCSLIPQHLQAQPLAPVSVTFTPAHILHLKKLCVPSFKCTSFEALAAHVWRCWARAMDFPASLSLRLLFSVNARKRLAPELPAGYYGNAFVLACAETSVHQLTASNVHQAVRLVQRAKERVDDAYVRSVVDLLQERRAARPDLAASLVISQWSKLGLEDVDFGEGRPVHMGPLASEVYCLFLPVVGDLHAVTVLVSMPQGVAGEFERSLTGCFGEDPFGV